MGSRPHWRYYVARLLQGKVKPFHSGGVLITDEMLTELEAKYASGEFEPFDGPVTYGPPEPPVCGRPRLANEETEAMSFKLPRSLAQSIREAARELGMSTSAFMREAAIEKLSSML